MSDQPHTIEVIPLHGLPEVAEGDDLAALVLAAASPLDGDVLVVAQKVVSKSEGAIERLRPGKDPALERRRLARAEAVRVVADTAQVLVVETRHGLVCANAGIDASNVAEGTVTVLPSDPDASARRLRDALAERAGVDVAVIVSDTFGRPWRSGQTDVAIGVAGFKPLRDERGGQDRQGRTLSVTQVAVADELAAAGDLARRKSEGVPAVLIRGFRWQPSSSGHAGQLVRAPAQDLFRTGRGGTTAALSRLAEPPPLGGAAVDAADLERAAAAVESVVGGVRVESECAEGGSRLTVTAAAARAEGLALGLLAAALLDLGYEVRLGPPADPAPHLRACRPTEAGAGAR